LFCHAGARRFAGDTDAFGVRLMFQSRACGLFADLAPFGGRPLSGLRLRLLG